MSKMITFASGWYNEEHDVLFCKAKGANSNLYDLDSRTGEKCPISIILRNDQGEEVEITEFKITVNKRQRPDKKDPTHEVKVKLG